MKKAVNTLAGMDIMEIAVGLWIVRLGARYVQRRLR